MAKARRTILTFSDLTGWGADNHSLALTVFLESFDLLPSDVRETMDVSQARIDPRGFFETNFVPVLIEDDTPPLFTGYYEPELEGSRVKTDAHSAPIYALPPEWDGAEQMPTRRQIETRSLLAGYEIAWLRTPLEAFLLQVQGSGRIRLEHGDTIRVGFAAKNGHPYSSLGKMLVDRGEISADAISIPAIRQWYAANVDRGNALLRENDSFVFFRRLDEIAVEKGPLGALGRSVTATRSIAVDPAFTPLGYPVWLEKNGPDPLFRLMVAQDIGGAIKGAQRADIFFGTGDPAGAIAGTTKESGRMITLIPKGAL